VSGPLPSTSPVPGARAARPGGRLRVDSRAVLAALWAGFTVGGLLLLEVVEDAAYGATVGVLAALLALAGARLAPELPWARGAVDARDLRVVGALYVTVVGCFLVAFQVFTTDRTAPLFISFAAGLLLGVVAPIAYTRRRGRPLSSLGLGPGSWRATAALGLALAGVQFALTLWGYDLPRDDEEWVPLLLMALVVGLFEAIFFRGFVQGRLEASLGLAPGVAAAAVLYAL